MPRKICLQSPSQEQKFQVIVMTVIAEEELEQLESAVQLTAHDRLLGYKHRISRRISIHPKLKVDFLKNLRSLTLPQHQPQLSNLTPHFLPLTEIL